MYIWSIKILSKTKTLNVLSAIANNCSSNNHMLNFSESSIIQQCYSIHDLDFWEAFHAWKNLKAYLTTKHVHAIFLKYGFFFKPTFYPIFTLFFAAHHLMDLILLFIGPWQLCHWFQLIHSSCQSYLFAIGIYFCLVLLIWFDFFSFYMH